MELKLSNRTQKQKPVVVKVHGDPTTDTDAAMQVHSRIVAGGIYANALGQGLAASLDGLDLGESAHTYVNALIEQLAPRDPLDQMESGPGRGPAIESGPLRGRRRQLPR
jgi:hypothetical protein